MDMTSLNLAPDEISFPGLGIDRLVVKSTAITVFGISIAWYGIIIVTGMILAILFGMSRMKKYGLSPDRTIDVVYAGLFGGIIGARAYYVIMNWSEFSGDLLSIINTRHGGLVIYGGIIGALITAVIVCKIRKVRILPLLDLAGMGFLIGQGIGRWGNFFNHECFGRNTDLPWGMTSGRIQEWISANAGIGAAGDLTPTRAVHPCFLYESLWCLTGFLVLFLISRKRKYDGQIFLLYVFWYGTGRAFIEGLRTDSLMLGNIRVSQLLAILSAITALILLFVFNSRVNRMGGEYVFYKDTEESKCLIAEDEAALAAAEQSAKEAKGKRATEGSAELDRKAPCNEETEDNSDNNETN